MENINRCQTNYIRDGDMRLISVNHGSTNQANLNTIALAGVLANRYQMESLNKAHERFQLDWSGAIVTLNQS